MLHLILKRFLLFIPTVFLTLSFCFWLGQGAMESHYINNVELKSKTNSNESFILSQFQKVYKLNWPLYYFSLNNRNQLDKETMASFPEWTNVMNNLQFKSGNQLKVLEFIDFISNEQIDSKSLNSIRELKTINFEEKTLNSKSIAHFKWYNKTITSDHFILYNYLPKFSWNGKKCQFHFWLSNLLQGHLGTSIHSQKKVNEKLAASLKNTMSISIISVILVFLVGIMLAYFSFKSEGSKVASILDQIMFFVYSIPNFWLASILILFFTNPQFLDWFPAYGFGDNEFNGFFLSFTAKAPYLVLPIICLSYGAVAIIYSQTLSSFKEESGRQYVKTAKGKGLNSNQILSQHIFKNAAFPIISLISGIFLFTISGSFVVEHIFAIPGIGKLTVESILLRDYPMLYALVLLFSVGAFLGYLLSDILYYFFDPRISNR